MCVYTEDFISLGFYNLCILSTQIEFMFNLPSEQSNWDDEIIEEFADYTMTQLRSDCLKLTQTQIVYSYCESLIVEDVEYAEEKIALILELERNRSWNCLCEHLPFEVLAKLKQAKMEVKDCQCNRQSVVESMLDLIVENTLLHSTLTKFAF